MRIRLKPWQSILLLAAIVALVLFSLERFRYRLVRSDADLQALLPQSVATTRFFIDVSALRQAHVLSLLAASQPAEESDYREFINETGFDYTRDADAIAGCADDRQIVFVVRGHFDWERLGSYATHHGGSCDSAGCKLPTTRPGRWASFRSIQPDVIALAVSANPNAVSALKAGKPDHRRFTPSAPLWIKPARSLLTDSAGLPLPARILASALQSAEEVTLSLGQASTSQSANQAAFELKVRARYPSPAMAETTRGQLELDTKMLKLELAREHQQPNPADLTGLLAAGTFQVIDTEVIGAWPIKKELLNSLQ